MWYLQLDIENSSSQETWQEVEFFLGKDLVVTLFQQFYVSSIMILSDEFIPNMTSAGKYIMS